MMRTAAMTMITRMTILMIMSIGNPPLMGVAGTIVVTSVSTAVVGGLATNSAKMLVWVILALTVLVSLLTVVGRSSQAVVVGLNHLMERSRPWRPDHSFSGMVMAKVT